MKNNALYLTAGGILVVGTGVWIHNKIKAVKSLDYTFGLIDTLKFELAETTFNQSVTFINTSNTAITINSGDISALVGGLVVGRVTVNNAITINAKTQTTIKFPVVLNNLSLIQNVPNFKAGNFDINYKGWLRSSRINFPINYTYKFKI